jgi:Ca2+-binding EF-hand superfamily protein
LNFNEFNVGLGRVITLSAPIKEKLFALMDRNQIGMVDYPNFLEVIQMSSANKGAAKKGDGQKDNFNWEEEVIEKIKHWVVNERITVDEAFKCFDKDFDGFINKEDLKWGLTNILQIPSEELYPTKIDRLYRLLDFYKTNTIQLSDF